ncbi:MAG: InlB B-repeat-containing protein [bacterium]|nr:InlB B-repeat-containing protein [bacterium]
MDSLFAGDILQTPPVLSCDIADTNAAEEYEIRISGADAGNNYKITHRNGKLRVVENLTHYTVTFDVQGHGTAPAALADVQEGTTIVRPAEDPVEEGYRFTGWYRDAACATRWDFEKDVVEADLTLYAGWEEEQAASTGKEIREEDVALDVEEFVYDGTEHRPNVVVTVDGVTLVEGKDYTVSYRDHINVGYGVVHIFGINDYVGSKVTKYFRISGLSLVVRAKNKVILIGDPIPAQGDYEYEVSGLAEGDTLRKEPSFICRIESSAAAGQYEIVPYGAAADNYSITYETGILTVSDEYVACTVTFDMQGHGQAVNYIGIKAGSTVGEPTRPEAAGYRFDGWYRDKACTKAWDFEKDIVQADLVLYAKWLRLASAEAADGFAIQEIGDLYYTGKPQKPAVSVYDGETLLKAGRDYQIKYYNHTNANKDDVRRKGSGTGTDFDPELPYVEIIGKGNYTETVRVNYNILRASIGDGGIDPAAGVTLKMKDQLVTPAKKSQNPFTSIKYVQAMRQNTDYTLSLKAVNAKDASGTGVTGEMIGVMVPAGYSGEFLLTVTGQGNYTGSICKTVQVADKAHLMKNMTVTLGRNQKNVTFTGQAIELTASETASADAFTVKYGELVLRPERDYTVSYQDNTKVGKAKMTVTGTGMYAGSQTVTFRIKGMAFSAGTVNVGGIENKAYTCGAWTQNQVVLTYIASGKRLVYGKDYTISYDKNVNKGTASMTFKGMETAGYSGSFKKTFKIAAADISRVSWAEGMDQLVFAYRKAGVKPTEEIVLTDQDGYRLKNGRDYTLRYVNNKAVADKNSLKPPMVIVKGKGNYTGEFSVPFRIVKADLREAVVRTTPVAYKPGKAADYVYKPTVKLLDGGSALRAGKDYDIVYQNNTQADYDAYMKSVSSAGVSAAGSAAPMAVITARADASYALSAGEVLTVPLPIYQTKLNKAEFWVETEQALYTGSQVKPAVKVRYGSRLLTEGSDYTVSYGKNVKSGKNQGSVTISGIAPEFGGSMTVKFDIVRKAISY